MEPAEIQQKESPVDEGKFNFSFHSFLDSERSQQTTVNYLKIYLRDTHRETIKKYRYSLKLDNHDIEQDHIYKAGNILLQAARYYSKNRMVIDLFADRGNQRLVEFTSLVLSKYLNYLEEDKIEACFSFHADIIFEDHIKEEVYLNIYPMFYFKNPDDRLLFKLRF